MIHKAKSLNNKMDNFINDKIKLYSSKINADSSKVDEHALGELYFYMALRRVLGKTASISDLGMMDAINDTLQEKGLIDSSASFLK